MRNKSVVSSLLLAVILLLAPQPAAAKMHSNTIDPDARVGAKGKRGMVTALIACTAGERVSVRITVTQEAANSVAEGKGSATCTGKEQRLDIKLKARYDTRLQSGSADACALAVTRQGEDVTDTRQWCKAITLGVDETGA